MSKPTDVQKPAPHRKPINRKLGVLAFVALAFAGLLAVIAVSNNDPAKRAADKAAEAANEVIAGQRQGEEKKAREIIDDIDRGLTKDAEQNAPQKESAPPDITQSPLPDRLAALDAAQQAVMANRRPLGEVAAAIETPPVLTRPDRPDAGFGRGQNAQGQGVAANGFFEAYDTEPDRSAGAAAADADSVFETITPQSPPSKRVISQGAMIPAVLASRIDTRVAGPIIAMVNRDVYDSATSRIRLIPKGSKLVGGYATDARPGVDRISATFERIILPDGRAIALPGVTGAGIDGTSGVQGKFHSNFLKAIGPSFIVALFGQTLDNQIKQPQSSSSFGTQSPSVAQQVVPKVNDMILDRYAGARPYFTATAGQPIRLILNVDLEIPAASSAVSLAGAAQ